MKTKSLDVIVRDALLDSGLPLHYYTRYLHHGLRCLDELSMDYDLGNVKTVVLDVTSYQRAVLPADFVDVVDVAGKRGEKLLSLERERGLNKLYNRDTEGNKIPYPSDTSITYDQEFNYNLLSGGTTMNPRGEMIGRYYGRMRNALLTYDIDTVNSELVFSNTMDLTQVTLTYVTSAVSRSTANVVTPYATDVITKYISMMAAKNEGMSLGKFQLAKQDYDNAKRVFRARMNAMDYSEILGLIRKGIHGGLKN